MIEISPANIAECPATHHPIRLDSGTLADRRWSRWSYRPGPARLLLRAAAASGLVTLHDPHGEVQRWESPPDALAWMANQCREQPVEGPPFKGGWIGYLGYDLGRYFEQIPEQAISDLSLPLFEFTYHDSVLAIDHATEQAYTIRSSCNWASGAIEFEPRYQIRKQPARSNFTPAAYQAAVQRGIDYIAAGDIFQVNLSQRFTAGLPDLPRRVYQRLLDRTPAWFGACLDYGDHALLSNSPELFLRITPEKQSNRRRVLTRPIKGTRPRCPGMEQELQESIKDQAELNMIVDLERNDLGRVCEIGSVKVTEPRTIESHPTVHHGVATVEGLLRDDVSFVDLLRATFPGGSITGAPKIRAMQIIDQLEPTRRGPYCGAIGYLSVDGHIEFNIAIRTILVERDRVHVPVGGGIVADSLPPEEYEETLVKAQAMFAALGIAADGT